MLENQNVRMAIVFIIGLLVGLGVYWTWDNRYAGPTSDVNDDEEEVQEEVALDGDNAIAVEDQAAGDKVTITKVKFENPGWVAVHDDVDGLPGRILGAKLFDTGEASGDVELLRKTVAGTSYLVVLHTDDGNYKNFNPKKDGPLTDDEGDVVMMKFTAEGDAETAINPTIQTTIGGVNLNDKE